MWNTKNRPFRASFTEQFTKKKALRHIDKATTDATF